MLIVPCPQLFLGPYVSWEMACSDFHSRKHRLASSCPPAVSPAVFQAALLLFLPAAAKSDCLGSADSLFGFDYLGPLQNHFKRSTVSKWWGKNTRLAKMCGLPNYREFWQHINQKSRLRPAGCALFCFSWELKTVIYWSTCMVLWAPQWPPLII